MHQTAPVVHVTASFGDAFWPALLATVLGGALVALGVYWFLDRRLRLSDRADQAKDAEVDRKAVRDAVLRLARGELEFVAAQVETFVGALEDDSVPFPPFDTNGWSLISQAHVFTTLKPESSDKLISAYNRVRTFNDRLAQYADLVQGNTATVFHITAAAATDEDGKFPDEVKKIVDQYKSLKAMNIAGLVQRLRELEPRLHEAIDAINGELDPNRPPSSSVRYVAPTPPMIVPRAEAVEDE